MQPDPAVGPRKPVLHELGVMIARIVEKDMDERQHRIESFDRFQKPDRRDGRVHGFDLDHPGLLFVELARDDARLVVRETRTMQQCDQSRAAFETRPNSCSIQAPTCRVDRGKLAATQAFKPSSCVALKKPALPPMSKLVRPSIPCCSKSLRQLRIVSSSSKNALATSRQLHPSSKSTNAFARRVTRQAADPSRAKAINLWRSSSPRSGSELWLLFGIRPATKCKQFSPPLQ